MTDTVVVPVNPSGTIVSDGNRNHGYQHQDGLTDKDRMALTSDNMSVLLAELNEGIATYGLANGVAIEKNGAANQLATEKTTAAIQLANALAFANTQNILISGFKDGRYDSAVAAAATALATANSTAAVQLQAANNKSEMEAKMAACCCEIKGKIHEDGEKTRDLINLNQSTNLAVQLSDAKAELAMYKYQAPHGNGQGS